MDEADYGRVVNKPQKICEFWVVFFWKWHILSVTRFVSRCYTTRPGAPTVVSYKHDQKYTLESFSECTGISNVVKVGWKSVLGGCTGVEEATFSEPSSCSWKNVSRWAIRPQSVYATGCRNCGYSLTFLMHSAWNSRILVHKLSRIAGYTSPPPAMPMWWSVTMS